MTKKALIVWGGWNGHEPKECAERYEAFLKDNDFEVTVTEDQDIYKDSDFMQSLSVICPIVTMSEIEKEQSEGLRAAVKSGVGIAGHHGGMGDSYRNDVEYQFMVGGQFICHPGGIIDYQVDIAGEDPITEGLSSFQMHSEQYFMHVDPSNDVVATTTMNQREEAPWVAGTLMPVAWKRVYGDGRVFYSALGHVNADFEVPEAWTIQQRGILWAAR